MTPAQIAAYAEAINVLLAAGAATVAQIRSWFGGGAVLSNDQLNQILDGVLTDVMTRLAQAKAAAGQ